MQLIDLLTLKGGDKVTDEVNIDCLFNEAVTLIEKGDLNPAIELLSAIAEKQPAIDALLSLGKCYKDLGKLTEAIYWFDRAVKEYPENELSSLSLFHALSNNEQNNEAINEMKRFLSIAHSDQYESFRADYYFEQAMLAEEEDVRVSLLIRATLASPESAEAFSELGKSYNKLGNVIESETAFKKSIDILDDGWARLYLGNLFFSLERLDEAEKEFTEAQKRLPNLAVSFWCQADVHLKRGDLIVGEQLYRAAIKIQPNDAQALARLGRFLLEEKRRAEGTKYLQMALEKNPTCEVALKWKKQFNIDTEA